MHTLGKIALAGLTSLAVGSCPNRVEGQEPTPLIHELPALRTGFEKTLTRLGVQITGTNMNLDSPAKAPTAAGLQATFKFGKKPD